MNTEICPTCRNQGTVQMPVSALEDCSILDFDCPTCKPWYGGFPGLSAKGEWIIAPSAPRQPAEWIGWRVGKP